MDDGSGLVVLLVSVGIMAVLALIILSRLGGSTVPASLPGIVTGTATATVGVVATNGGLASGIQEAAKQACATDTESLRAAEDEDKVIRGHYSTVAGLVSSGFLAGPSTLHVVPASTLTNGNYQVWTGGATGTTMRCGPGGTPVTDGSNGAF